MQSLRTALCATLSALVLLLSPGTLASAQDWPSQPIRLVVTASPGGAIDTTARLLQNPLAKILGQPVIVENKPGAGGMIATEEVVRSKPDGYNFVVIYSSHAANPALLPNLPYDSLKDVTPITFLWRAYLAFTANKNAPISSFEDLLKQSRDNPGSIAYGAGVGTSSHLAAAQVAQLAGIELSFVPFGGAGPALNNVLSGEVPVLVSNILVIASHVKEGNLRALAVTAPDRSQVLPDVPSIAELGFPGFQASEWAGILGPAGLSDDIVRKMNAAVHEAMADPDVAKRMSDLGLVQQPTTPEEFQKILVEETETIGEVIRRGNIKAQ